MLTCMQDSLTHSLTHSLIHSLTHPRSLPFWLERELGGIKQGSIISWEVGILKELVLGKALPPQLLVVLGRHPSAQLARRRGLNYDKKKKKKKFNQNSFEIIGGKIQASH